jgi:thiol:disulfide interchange protein
MINHRFYKTFFTIFIVFFLAIPAFSEGFTRGKIKIPFEPGSVLKNQKIALKDKTELLVTFKLEKDSYIYRDSLKVEVNPLTGIKFGKPVFPKPEKKMDQFLNKTKEIYHNSFTIKIPLEVSGNARLGKGSLSSVVWYQGCNKTICFVPQEKIISAPYEIVKKK